MKQIRQYLRNGALDMSEVPLPQVRSGEVLIRTHFSFVSVGTEKMKVTQARMSLVDKARERPDQVRQVLDTLKEQGLVPTLRKVQERLKAPATLGYSCAGTVIEAGSAVDELHTGDRVAAIGEGIATHAEYNAVPRNLVVPVPAGVSMEAASATAIGAIALQGMRQARLELGETVAVIGLGLLGQFLVQLCRASGCRVVGVDLDASKCDLAVANGAEAASGATPDDALYHALRVSGGRGVDAVLVTTSTKSNDPIEMAAALVRDRGRVVCLGNTAIQLDWRTWFGKEIDFLFSRAMGAGMFDPDYIARGSDYPIGYVRWTAQRNMEAFLDLVAQGRLDMSRLITHRFPFGDAMKVFDQMAGGELASAVGIVFEYPEPERVTPAAEPHTLRIAAGDARGAVRLGLIGAGNYAKSMLLPHFEKLEGLSLQGVCTAHGANAEALARRYGFRYATTEVERVIGDPEINAVLIATRHDSHARFARMALEAGKHVYVEKPLALTEDELAPIVAALGARGADAPSLWVGHNRRFSALSRETLAHFAGVKARQVVATVRAAPVPADSWYQDPAEGGGILFGDVCHFIDLAIWFAKSLPVEVHAIETPDPSHRHESWAIQMRFASGGIGIVDYVCGSHAGWERESVDVLGGGRSARLLGFRELRLRGGAGGKRIARVQPDAGQRAMLEAMMAQFRRASGAEDFTESFVLSAQALLAARRSIAERRVVTLETRFPFALG
ncbi:MAG: zinc-binding dehydrogenase [Candidatus Eisenbacteria bacterium]|uniref:Zinc-binding dehydrogenase n=1 Tax=Eiseniibacteriota bacterium TaxID=2212470 RepID=A0A538SUX5_UNCEI|nr:MAG: zinc-binding dehydrogenase [Candidatus Eisenbacteria bacterium]